MGYRVTGMAASGVSAGGTLAMNLAYGGNSAIPVRFVFELAAPTYFCGRGLGQSDEIGQFRIRRRILPDDDRKGTECAGIPAGNKKKYHRHVWSVRIPYRH